MKKKVLALLSALTIMATGSMTAFAASPTVPGTEAPAPGQVVSTTVTEMKTATEYTSVTQVSDGFSVTTVTQTVIQSVAVTVQNTLLNNLSNIGATFASAANSGSAKIAASSYSNIAAAAEDTTKRVTASVLSVVDVNAETATKAANGNYVVTMNISSILSTDAIAVLHHNGSVWETIIPTNVSNGSVTFETASLSPISIVKLEVENLTMAPKTGEAMAMMAVVMLVGLAGVIFCGKKYFG